MLADLVLLVHFAVALSIAAGFLLIPWGAVAGWRWVRLRWLRLTHVGTIVFVALESLAGIACPLTVWEDMLRGAARSDAGFVERWLGRLLYWDLPMGFFTGLYVALALAALVLWWRVPPRP